MNWAEAKDKITNSLKKVGQSVDDSSTYRNIKKITTDGYVIGRGKTNTVSVKWNDLEKIYKASYEKGYYDHTVYKNLFGKPSATCIIHIIGHVFDKSNIMRKVGNKFIVIN